jgi:hypothetical protein
VIPVELWELLNSGPSVAVGTRDGRLRPECVRAAGVALEGGTGEAAALTIFLPECTSARTIANLRANGRVAVTVTRVGDNRSYQLKGRALSIRDATPEDRQAVERYLAAFLEALATLGYPRGRGGQGRLWPCLAVRTAVEAVFVQTPGPGAGAALSTPAPLAPELAP